MRVALVYDRLNKVGGAEHILQAFHDLYPDADWYTSFWDPVVAPFSQKWKVHASFLNRIPFLRRRHEWVPFLMPFIFESYDFSGYELVISIGSAECKGIMTRPETLHIHYCLTPTRYLYSHQSVYLTNVLYRRIADILTKWDAVAATRPDYMISISEHVKNRVQKYYYRNTDVIYPPVDIGKFTTTELPTSNFQLSDYYLIVSRLVPYKNIDLAVRTFNKIGKRLIVAGDGSERNKLRRRAQSNITFLGAVNDAELRSLYTHCQAFIQCNEEDFGIAMVEAQAAGKPVIAYQGGGAHEIIKPRTGVLYNEMSVASLKSAIAACESREWSSAACKQNAMRFDKVIWSQKMSERINEVCQAKKI